MKPTRRQRKSTRGTPRPQFVAVPTPPVEPVDNEEAAAHKELAANLLQYVITAGRLQKQFDNTDNTVALALALVGQDQRALIMKELRQIYSLLEFAFTQPDQAQPYPDMERESVDEEMIL